MALSRPRLLVLRALGLGDFLTGVPALRALRRAYPSHEILLACPPVLAPLVSLAEVADGLVPGRGLEPVSWDGPRPELAVNLHGKGPQSHRLLRAVSPGRLVAFGSVEAGHEGPSWVAEEHEVRRWCRLLEEDLGILTDPGDLLLRRPGEAGVCATGPVVVHPGAAFPARRWPAERFAAVARWAAEAGHHVVITGGHEEVELAREVQRLAGLPGAAVLAGRTDLMRLASVVASASLVFCGDTGMAHVATAFGTPSVVLFGPVSPALWGPPAHGPHRVLWHGDGSGDPWGAEVDPALLKVSVDEVVAAAAELLASPR